MKASKAEILLSLLILTPWLAGADSLDIWHRRAGVPPFTQFSAGAVGAGTLVALGGQVVLTSPDANRWSSRTLDSFFNNLIYGNGVFILVGDTILTSSNAVDWTQTADSPGIGMRGATFGNGLFVVTSFDGTVLTSTNGTHWTSRPTGIGNPNGLAYGNGLFVAAGPGGTLFTSPNAVTWTARASGTTLSLSSVAYGNGRFVAVGYGCPSWPCSDVIVTSTDGVNWTAFTNSLPFAMNSVTFGNGLFAVATGGQWIYTSSDGINWTSRVYARSWLNSISYSDGTFLAVGGNGLMLTSTNGTNWIESDVPLLTSVAAGPSGYVAVGFKGTVLTSPDGGSWTLRNPGTPLHLYSVAHGSGTFAAVGQIILSSTNGIDWNVRDTGPNYDFQTVVYLNGLFMAIGANGAMKVSTDGVTWASRSSGTTATLYGLAFGNGIYVLTGAGGLIRTSSDGVSWTPRTSGTAQDINGVTYGNGLFVAQGNSGVILTSPNGVTWTSRNSGTGQGLATSAYGGGHFTVVGLGGTILTSTNGSSWQSRASGTSQLLLGILAGPHGFVIVGENGTILESDPVGVRIVEQPQSDTVFAGSTVEIRVGVAGLPPFHYFWLKDGSPLPNQTTSTLTLSNLPLSAGGSYSVVISNAWGAVTSAPAILSLVPLIIVQHPQSTNAAVGSTATFTVVVDSAVPVTYQWTFNGTNLPGEQAASLVLPNVQLSHQGDYAVVVSNLYGVVASDPAQFGVLVRLAVTQAPLSQSVPPGGTATFSVGISGDPPPFSYEWRKTAPLPLFTNTFVLNERVIFFTVTNVQNSVTGSFRVVIRNAASPNGVSPAVFNLTLSTDSDGDGLPDAWETAYPTAADTTGDADLDGMANWQEYMAGTNPTNALSYLKVDRISGVGSTGIEFMAASNKTYSVQYCDSLHGAAWSKLADVVARTSDRVETVTDPNGTSNRYYRLVTPRQE